jgi:hypothetical protein
VIIKGIIKNNGGKEMDCKGFLQCSGLVLVVAVGFKIISSLLTQSRAEGFING